MQKPIANKIRQQGQALILALCLITVGLGTVVILYNTGQAAAEKARLVNAADAAAYSGAISMARNLNFIAYTNRAMVANHIMVGHLVSYVSWLRMVDDSTDKLPYLVEALNLAGDAVASASFGLAAAVAAYFYISANLLDSSIQATEVIAPLLLKGTEGMAKIYVPAIEIVNNGFYVAQQTARWNLINISSAGSLSTIMNETAQVYNKEIKINGIEELLLSAANINMPMPNQIQLIAIQAINDINKVLGFLQNYHAGNNNSRIKKLTLDSLGSSRDWIQTRKRTYKVGVIEKVAYSIHKKGSTKLLMKGNDSGDTDWKAKDKMGGFGKGKATATEFLGSYTGVPGYVDTKEIDSPQDITLPLTVFATLPFNQARIFHAMGMKASVKEFSTVSRAEVYHKRPDDESKFKPVGAHGEYPNVYNPFWEARLIKNDVVPTF